MCEPSGLDRDDLEELGFIKPRTAPSPVQPDVQGTLCSCSDPGWTHAAGVHDWLAARLAEAEAKALRKYADHVMAEVARFRPNRHEYPNTWQVAEEKAKDARDYAAALASPDLSAAEEGES